LRSLISTNTAGETKIKSYPENAPVDPEDELLETFIVGSLVGRNMERDRLYGELVTYEGLSVLYDHYIRVHDVLRMIDRDEDPTGAF
jgi:hypothetical protein